MNDETQLKKLLEEVFKEVLFEALKPIEDKLEALTFQIENVQKELNVKIV